MHVSDHGFFNLYTAMSLVQVKIEDGNNEINRTKEKSADDEVRNYYESYAYAFDTMPSSVRCFE